MIGLLVFKLLPLNQIDEHAQAADELADISVRAGSATQPVTLRDRLIFGLQARLKSEVAFVDLVVVRVRTGQLPQRLVDETFFWAREHTKPSPNGRRQRPIVYFQPAMKLRAEKIGVAL
jgi:hypothetical protein